VAQLQRAAVQRRRREGAWLLAHVWLLCQRKGKRRSSKQTTRTLRVLEGAGI